MSGTSLHVHEYLLYPRDQRDALDDWAKRVGVLELGVRSVMVGEGRAVFKVVDPHASPHRKRRLTVDDDGNVREFEVTVILREPPPVFPFPAVNA